MLLVKGIELLEERQGRGEPACRGDRVVYNLRLFLNRGEEVPINERQVEHLPAQMIRSEAGRPFVDHVLTLGRRRAVAAVEYALLGMRVGGYRRVRASPHLAYGERGVPGLIPPRAVLVIELWLRDRQPAVERRVLGDEPRQEMPAATPESASSAWPLRPARREDSRRLAELIAIAGEGIPLYLWSLSADPGEDPLQVGAQRAAREYANYSYRHAVVADHAGAAVAMLLAYPLPEAAAPVDSEDFPEVVRPFIELELRVPATFYINALATLPGYRGRGLGSRLLHAAAKLAAAAGCTELSLQVFEQNEGAVRLYRRHGYRVVDRRPCVPHRCHRYDGDVLLLTKPVDY